MIEKLSEAIFSKERTFLLMGTSAYLSDVSVSPTIQKKNSTKCIWRVPYTSPWKYHRTWKTSFISKL